MNMTRKEHEKNTPQAQIAERICNIRLNVERAAALISLLKNGPEKNNASLQRAMKLLTDAHTNLEFADDALWYAEELVTK